MVKGVFFDISGVLLDGADIITTADQALDNVRQAGLPYRLVTNTSQKTRAMLVDQLQQAGLPVSIEEVYTAPLAARDYVIKHQLRPYCLIHPDLEPEFSNLDQSQPNAVVIGDAAEGFNYENLNTVFRLCMDGAPLIAIGHNKYFKKAGVFYLDAGPFVEAIEYACDIKAIITGKPSSEFFEQVLASIDLPAADVALIGDDIHGDIKGAVQSGMQSRLVRTGKYRDQDEHKVTPPPQVVDNVLQAVQSLL